MIERETAVTESKRGFWPSPQDYNEAIQHPAASLCDSSLHGAEAEVDSIGLPRPVSGGFASVYKLRAEQRDWAIRFFLLNISNQQDRYARISEFVKKADLPYMVNFEYQPQGVRIAGTSFPLLKMEWVDGLTLDQYVLQHANHPAKLKVLSDSFQTLDSDLKSNGIAHGDLQHGNIIVTPDGKLRLVDYDGLYIPSTQDSPSTERGHPNYQHPDRRTENFDQNLDNFSSLVIYTSLRAIAKSPHLIQELDGCSDNLLFRSGDFAAPEQSRVFHELEKHTDEEVRHLAKLIRSYLQEEPGTVPPLKMLPDTLPKALPELMQTVRGAECKSPMPSQSTDSHNNPPEWWNNTAVRTMPAAVDLIPARVNTPVPASVNRAILAQVKSLQMSSNQRHVGYNRKLRQMSPHMAQFAILCILATVWLMVVCFLLSTGTAFIAPLGLLLVPTAIAYGASTRLWKDPLRHLRLARKGTATVGTISEICQLTQESDTPRYNVYYSFECNGKVFNYHVPVNCIKHGLSAGDQVVVLFDPEDPTNSVIHELSNYKAID